LHLATIDWVIVAGVLALTLATGLWVARRSSADSTSFFLAGRGMPWWLLGTSMVATTFATDTPNLVTNLVRTGGVAANWVWWCFLITGMLTAFVYARLWRRLGVTTDIEFYERRYAGREAAFLRGFRAVYLGFFFNVMIMANVTLAAIKIGGVLFSASPETVVMAAGLITVIFATVGGFLGVLITDMLLFVLAMSGALAAAWYAVNHPAVGGLNALISHPAIADKLSLLPDMSDPDQWVPLLLIPLAVQWWSVWYPGAEPGGGGYVAQRMLAAKNERHAMAAVAFFNFAHYALRPWPWILVALASIVVFPDLESLSAALPRIDAGIVRDDLAYPAMLTFLPAGVMGLVVASLMSAYVSTISTSLNWGASYLVNDVYGRFVRPDASERSKVRVGRVMTVALMICASALALALESALQAFHLLLTIGAGTGLLFLLRWFWSRINAWSEISAMVFSFAFAVAFEFWGEALGVADLADWQRFLLAVGLTTLGWVAVTLVTQPTAPEKLAAFREEITGAEGASLRSELRAGIKTSLWAIAAVYSLMFGTGYLLYGEMVVAIHWLVVAAIAGRTAYVRARDITN
jgi:Na+/proline symporter